MKYKYTMKFNAQYLADIIQGATTRKPDELGKSGLHTFSFTFKGSDLTVGQRIAAYNALPEWMRLMYDFEEEILPDDVSP